MNSQPSKSRPPVSPASGANPDPALEALRESEARNRALIHAIPDLVFTNRRNGEYLSVHSANPDLLAAPPESVLHRRIDEVLPPPTGARCLKAIATALDTGAVQEITYELPLRGQPRHFEARIAPCTADTVLTIIRDITDRKQAEGELRLFQALVEHSSDAIGISTPAGLHYYQNAAFDELFGAIGTSPPDTLYVDRQVGNDVFGAIMSGRNWQGEVRMHGRDRSILDILLRAYAIRDREGRIIGLVGLHTDVTARRQAEAAVQESRARFAALFDANPTGLMLCNRATRIIEQINPAGAALIGLPPERIVGRVCHGFLCPAERAACPVCDLGQTIDRSERVLLRADGVRLPILKTVVPLRFGDADYLLESFIDVSDRKRAEAELRERESNYFDLFNTVTQAIYIQKPDGTFVNVNQGALDMYGYAREEFIGQTPAFLAAPGRNDLAGLAAIFDRAFRGEPQTFEFWGRRKNGAVFPKEVWVVRGRYFGQDVLIAIANDITRHKQAEAELREREQLLAEAQSVANMGSYVLDVPSGRWECSEMLDRILGLPSAGEHTVAAWENLLHPDDRDRLQEYFQHDVIAGGQRFDADYRIVRPADGETRWVHGLGRLEFDAAGRPVRMIGTIQDITERKRAEQERARLETDLQQSRKLESIGRLAGGVAHDFNNMLTVILGNLDLALEQIPADHPVRTDLAEARKAAERSAHLTRQLLAFARKQAIAPRVLDLNESVAHMLQMLHRLIGENVAIDWRPAPGPLSVRMDPMQIDQILANLCVNARDAIAGAGAIVIETAPASFDEADCAGRSGLMPGAYVRLSVRDNGAGMDRETLAHLFEPFYTSKEFGKGTGLGLAMVYGIVQQNRGFIDVYSEPGRGAAFHIFLPRQTDAAEPEPQPAPAPAAGGHETLLIVEDELPILQLAAKTAAQLGYVVLAAPTPAEALRLAREHPGEIHLLLTDVVMPEMNGRELARQLVALQPRIKLLFMSGFTANVIASADGGENGAGFLQKPFSRFELAAKIRATLDAPRP